MAVTWPRKLQLVVLRRRLETSRMQGEKIDVLAERLRKSWLGAMHGRHGAMT